MKYSFCKKYFGLIFLLACISCKKVVLVESTYKSKDAVFTNMLSLEVEESLSLSLDSITAPTSPTLQHIIREGREMLAFWNNNDKSIIYFDLESGQVIDKQFFETSGPNAVFATNFLIHSVDSIFMTDAVQSTYLVNSKSVVLEKYPVEDTYELKNSPGPYVWTGSPMTYVDGDIYFQGYIGGIFDQPNMAKLNLKAKEIDYFSGYPEFYKKGYWRGGYEYMSYAYNPIRNLFVYSFVADHYVRVQSKNDLKSHNAYFGGTADFQFLKPPRGKMGDPGGEKDERKFKLQPSFGLIHYDRFNDLYYRFAYDALTESDLDSGDPLRSTIKPSRIIVLNSDFVKVGEHTLPRFKYNPKMSFTGKKGLYVMVKNEDNEDILEFDIFKPLPKDEKD